MFWNEKDKTIGNFQRNLSLLNLLGRAPQATLTRFNKDIFFNKDFLYKIIKRICSQVLQFIYVNQEYGAPFQKKLVTFLRTKYFFDAGSSCFCRQEILFCATSTFFFGWHETLFCATSTRFCRHQSTFCATSNFLFRHKITFRVTPNFCFGHHLKLYVMMIYLHCHIATKYNHVSKNK